MIENTIGFPDANRTVSRTVVISPNGLPVYEGIEARAGVNTNLPLGGEAGLFTNISEVNYSRLKSGAFTPPAP